MVLNYINIIYLTSQDDKFHKTPVTNSLTSASPDLCNKFINNGIPPASLIARLFSSFCLPYDKFLPKKLFLSLKYSILKFIIQYKNIYLP